MAIVISLASTGATVGATASAIDAASQAAIENPAFDAPAVDVDDDDVATQTDDKVDDKPPADPLGPRSTATTPRPKNSVCTLSKFNQLKMGMSYARVKEIIGSAGTETTRIESEAVPGIMEASSTVSYMWQGDEGSATVIFQNDKITHKTQFGLK